MEDEGLFGNALLEIGNRNAIKDPRAGHRQFRAHRVRLIEHG